jgi:hypothetical protein
MSFEAVSWAYEQKPVDLETGKPSPVAQAVLACLAHHLNMNVKDKHFLRCDPSIKTISEETLLGARTVSKALRALEHEKNKRLIEIRRRRQKSSAYRLAFLDLHVVPIKNELRSARECLIGTSCHAPRAPKPKEVREPEEEELRSSRTRTREAVGKTKPEKIKRALEAALSSGQADAVIEHRHAIHSPLTLRAAELLAKEFTSAPVACGLTADAAADHMIARGWRGFKADWVANDQRRDADRANGQTPGRRQQPEDFTTYLARETRQERARERQQGGYLDDENSDDTGPGRHVRPGKPH